MRFRTTQRPRGVLRRQDQRRLNLIVFGLGLVLLCFSAVRRPAFWAGLFPTDPAAEQAPDVPTVVRPEVPATNGLQHDEFLTESPAASGESVTALRIPYAEQKTEAAASSSGIPPVPESLLSSVRDDVIGIHSAESEAYYAAMKLAAKVEQRKDLRAPKGAYALFMDAPRASRGLPWRLEGKLRRLSEVKGKANAFGVRMLYDAWITSPDSGDQLIHVVAMQSDKSLAAKIGEENATRSIDFGKNAPDVSFTGYFFKREAYRSRSEAEVSLAPMFVAGTLHEILHPVATSTRADELTPYLWWLAVAICIGIALMIWSFFISDSAHLQTRTHQLTKLPAHASFEDVTATPVSEALQNLSTPE